MMSVWTVLNTMSWGEDEDLEKLFAEDDESKLKSKKLLDAYDQLTINQKNAVYFYYIKNLRGTNWQICWGFRRILT